MTHQPSNRPKKHQPADRKGYREVGHPIIINFRQGFMIRELIMVISRDHKTKLPWPKSKLAFMYKIQPPTPFDMYHLYKSLFLSITDSNNI